MTKISHKAKINTYSKWHLFWIGLPTEKVQPSPMAFASMQEGRGNNNYPGRLPRKFYEHHICLLLPNTFHRSINK